MKEQEYINRNDFGTSTVYALLKSGTLSRKEALRLLEEAVHVIINLRQHNDSILRTIAAIQNEIKEYNS